MIPIDDNLAIPDEEVTFATSRSGGPGGQNVNKLETRVTLRFDLAGSAALSRRSRRRGCGSGWRRGSPRTACSRSPRSGTGRRARTGRRPCERFAELLRENLREETPRRKTRPSRAAKARRLDAKRRQSQRKRERSGDAPDRLRTV